LGFWVEGRDANEKGRNLKDFRGTQRHAAKWTRGLPRGGGSNKLSQKKLNEMNRRRGEPAENEKIRENGGGGHGV